MKITNNKEKEFLRIDRAYRALMDALRKSEHKQEIEIIRYSYNRVADKYYEQNMRIDHLMNKKQKEKSGWKQKTPEQKILK
jgi:hypothetical protein